LPDLFVDDTTTQQLFGQNNWVLPMAHYLESWSDAEMTTARIAASSR
jgi:hypothetical protein